MGKASRKKHEKRLLDNIKINTSDNPFSDYVINTNLNDDLIEINDQLIQELISTTNIKKDELLTLKAQGFKYSKSRDSFLMFDN